MLAEAASDDVTPGEQVQRGEAVLAHRVDVILKFLWFKTVSD